MGTPIFPKITFEDEIQVDVTNGTNAYGAKHAHLGMEWNVGVKLSHNLFKFDLQCSGRRDQIQKWHIGADVTSSVVHPNDADATLAQTKKWRFTRTHDVVRCLDRQRVEQSGQWLTDGKIRVKTEVLVRQIDGIVEPKPVDFNARQASTDVVLCVGARKFHVSKGVLAEKSDYFHGLFFGGFMETNATEVDVGPDVDADVFHQILLLAYESIDITTKNVKSLLHYADRFQFTTLTTLIESHLLNSHSCIMTVNDKLILADKYKMDNLLRKMVLAIRKPTDLTGLPLAEMCPRSLEALIERLIETQPERDRGGLADRVPYRPPQFPRQRHHSDSDNNGGGAGNEGENGGGAGRLSSSDSDSDDDRGGVPVRVLVQNGDRIYPVQHQRRGEAERVAYAHQRQMQLQNQNRQAEMPRVIQRAGPQAADLNDRMPPRHNNHYDRDRDRDNVRHDDDDLIWEEAEELRADGLRIHRNRQRLAEPVAAMMAALDAARAHNGFPVPAPDPDPEPEDDDDDDDDGDEAEEPMDQEFIDQLRQPQPPLPNIAGNYVIDPIAQRLELEGIANDMFHFMQHIIPPHPPAPNAP